MWRIGGNGAGGRLRRRATRRSQPAGFSLAETTIILAAASVLAATAAPSVMDYVAQARFIKASGDEQVLISGVSRLLFDVGRFTATPGGEEPMMLVGPGEDFAKGNPASDAPTDAPAAGGMSLGASGDTANAAAAGAATVGTGPWAAPPDGNRVQNLEDHLVTNMVGYRLRAEGAFAKGWSGPYVDKVPADPWGHRYAINIGATGRGPVIILSAGPDGVPETPFIAPGLRIGGDDVVGLLGNRR